MATRVSPAHGHQGFRWGFQGSNGGYYWTPTLHIRGPAGYVRGPINLDPWTPAGETLATRSSLTRKKPLKQFIKKAGTNKFTIQPE
jgi:hypothetical protein